MQLKEKYIQALCREMELRKGYLQTDEVRTLYFGGGTPSCLSLDEMSQIIFNLENNYHLTSDAERTIEVNPEDVDRVKLLGWLELGFNRLSMGVQSFHDAVLKGINRRHTAAQAVAAVEEAYRCGFRNISIDLMLGLPGSTDLDLRQDLEIVRRLPVEHAAVYLLSVEPGTVLEHRCRKGTFSPEDEDCLAEKYLMVAEYLKDIGFEHYEISNFARNFNYSLHNTAYWQQQKYIGLGAAAHSYDGRSRQWNIAHIKNYIDSLDQGILNFEKEELTLKDHFNEYLMTSLRTKWGIKRTELEMRFPQYGSGLQIRMAPYLERGLVAEQNGHWVCSERGWLLSDSIFADLFED